MGDKSAIASKGSASAQGRLVWQIKQRIDSRFVNRFSHLPAMQVEIDLARGLLDSEDESQLRSHALRCAGCGAKVASGVLDEVLDELHEGREPRRVEDASSVALPDGRVLLQSIDQLSAFINDPFLFARIASNHALSDIYAMGAQPHSALAVIGMPMASRTMSKRLLSELMQGCKLTLAENDCELLGGHTAENPQLQLGLAVNAFAKPDECLTKDGASATDLLILTRPLGTGTLLAGDMRALSRHRWIESAVEQMLLSNRRASQIFSKHRASACTDITGFGFAGHLAEMITPNGAAIELALDKVPLLEGSLELAERGVRSSLYESNKRAASLFYNDEAYGSDARFKLLFDPQTAGGLLASIPEQRAGDCLAQLREAGYGAAAIVGRVVRTGDATASVVLK
jgi:selenide,water dikinase